MKLIVEEVEQIPLGILETREVCVWIIDLKVNNLPILKKDIDEILMGEEVYLDDTGTKWLVKGIHTDMGLDTWEYDRIRITVERR